MKFTKKKIFIIEIVILSLVLIGGVTYSMYTSNASLTSEVEIAQFIFNSNKTDVIEIPVDNLAPGDTINHTFSVANNLESKVSEVTVEYQITLKTIHSIPLTYELVKVTDIEETIFTCNETNTRNVDGLLECKTAVMQMSHETAKTDDYKLYVSFPAIYNDIAYSNLVDYIDIELESWQKVD